jgi:hypothetical protein
MNYFNIINASITYFQETYSNVILFYTYISKEASFIELFNQHFWQVLLFLPVHSYGKLPDILNFPWFNNTTRQQTQLSSDVIFSSHSTSMFMS